VVFSHRLHTGFGVWRKRKRHHTQLHACLEGKCKTRKTTRKNKERFPKKTREFSQIYVTHNQATESARTFQASRPKKNTSSTGRKTKPIMQAIKWTNTCVNCAKKSRRLELIHNFMLFDGETKLLVHSRKFFTSQMINSLCTQKTRKSFTTENTESTEFFMAFSVRSVVKSLSACPS